MKKILLSLGVLLVLSLCGVFWLNRVIYDTHHKMFHSYIHINVSQNSPLMEAERLQTSLTTEGKKTALSYNNGHSSAGLNIYTAQDVLHLPRVLDNEAINFLWIDKISNKDNPELLRPFDVIIVKNMPAFEHLKAINVRTAFIPDAIDITDAQPETFSDRVMFWGDGEIYSLALSLVGPSDIKLDVYGSGFEGKWPIEDIKGITPEKKDFRNHLLVLADQSDEEIANQIFNQRLIKIIENGGVPFVRYNPAIEKLFGDAVPMYHNSIEFEQQLRELLNNPDEIAKRRAAIKHFSSRWNSQSQAKKFIELFEIMEKKRL